MVGAVGGVGPHPPAELGVDQHHHLAARLGARSSGRRTPVSAASSWPSSRSCGCFSSAWSVEAAERHREDPGGHPASTHCATRSSCASSAAGPAGARCAGVLVVVVRRVGRRRPRPRGSSRRPGPGRRSRRRPGPAAPARPADGCGRARPAVCRRRPCGSFSAGHRRPPRRRCVAPASSGGSTGSNETASRGSPPTRVQPAAEPAGVAGPVRVARSARCPSTGSGCGPASGSRRRARSPAAAAVQPVQPFSAGLSPVRVVEPQHLVGRRRPARAGRRGRPGRRTG